MKLVKQVFAQEMHSCGPATESPASLTLELMDAGVGEYLVLSADQISFDNERELDAIVEIIKAMLTTTEKT